MPILIPENQLCLPVTVKIAEDLVVVLGPTRVLDFAAHPGRVWLVVWIGVLPPPDFVGLGVSAHHDVEVAVDVVVGATGLDVQHIVVDQELAPVISIASVPDHRWPG